MAFLGVLQGGTSWNVLSGFTQWVTIMKPTDESRSSTTVITADSALQFPLDASTKYQIRGRVWYDTTAAADFKWRHVGPASPTLVRVTRGLTVPGGPETGVVVDLAFSAADITMVSTGTNGGYFTLDAIVHNGLNAGTFIFSWAQNTSDAGATTVRAGSYLEFIRI